MSLLNERLNPPKLTAYVADAVNQLNLGPLLLLRTIFDIRAPELAEIPLPVRSRRGLKPYRLLSLVAAAASNGEGYYYPTIDDIVQDFHGDRIVSLNNQRLARCSKTTNGTNILEGITIGFEMLRLDQEDAPDLPEDIRLLRAWFLEMHPSNKDGQETLLLTSLLRRLSAKELHQTLNSYVPENGDSGLKDAEPNSTDLKILESEPSLSNPREETLEDNVSLYLREASRSPLLTAEQEVALAKTIEIGEAAKIQLNETGLDQSQNIQLAEYLESSAEARRKLTESNLRLVVAVVRKYLGRGVEFLDLVQEGNIGLGRAVEKYDWRKGYRFSTYAYWWIRQAVTRAVAEQSQTIRIPVHMVESIGKLNGAENQLRSELNRDPTRAELASTLGITPEKIKSIQTAKKRTVSLEAPIKNKDDLTWADLTKDHDALSVEEIVAKKRLKAVLEAALDSLTPRQRQVIALRFGLIDDREKTLSEVGEELTVSRERVRQIEKEALDALRTPSLAQQLKEYLD